MSKEALESGVAQIKGARALPLNLEHDVTLPPVGKVIDAWIEPTPDGEHQLVALEEHFGDGQGVTLNDGVQLWRQTSERDHRPFVRSVVGSQEKTTIEYDLGNFRTDERNAFLDQLPSSSEFTIRPQVRKSLVPDPILFVTLSVGFASLLTAKTLYKTADKIADDVSSDLFRLYSMLKAAAIVLARFSIPRLRPVTYVMILPGNPTIEFVVRTRDVDVLLSAMAADELRIPLANADALTRQLPAAKIQFLLDGDNAWRFNYLLTETGGVVGTPELFSRRARRFDLEGLSGRSIGASCWTKSYESMT